MDLLFKLNPVALTFLIPGLISIALIVYTWKNRHVEGSRVFSFIMLAIAVWSLAYGAELTCLTLEGMLFFLTFEYFGIASIPVLLLTLTFIYTGRRDWVRPRYLIGLFIIPYITLILVSTTKFHDLYYSSISLDAGGLFPQLALTQGVWYWINSIYSYCAVLLSAVLLVEKLRYPQPVYRPQIIALLIGVSVPWIVNILYLTAGFTLYGHVDPTPFAFAVSGLIIAWSIFRFRLFSVVPIAREYVIESMKEGVIVVDSGSRLEDVNTASKKIFGLDNSDIGKPLLDLLKDWPEIVRQYRLPENTRLELDHWKDGEKHYFEANTSTLSDRGGRPLGRLITIRDITEFKNLEHKLEQMATHDHLTGLPGRVLLMDRVVMAIARAKRKKVSLALMMLDLDRFKKINDTLGHIVGDNLLKAVAARLENTMRKNDTSARIGGDEFVILLPEITGVDEAIGAASRLLLSFQDPLAVNGHTVKVSLSLGIAIFPEHGECFDELLKNADSAMYQAKKNGRNRYVLFNSPGKSISVPLS